MNAQIMYLGGSYECTNNVAKRNPIQTNNVAWWVAEENHAESVRHTNNVSVGGMEYHADSVRHTNNNNISLVWYERLRIILVGSMNVFYSIAPLMSN
jgi:hypothetical protein